MLEEVDSLAGLSHRRTASILRLWYTDCKGIEPHLDALYNMFPHVGIAYRKTTIDGCLDTGTSWTASIKGLNAYMRITGSGRLFNQQNQVIWKARVSGVDLSRAALYVQDILPSNVVRFFRSIEEVVLVRLLGTPRIVSRICNISAL